MSSLSGIKSTLDAYISKNYDEVRRYTNHLLTSYNNYKNIKLSMLKADTIINNAYLHVVTIEAEKTDENSVKSYLLNSIKMQILWPTSLSHKQDDCHSQEPIIVDEPEDTDILDKIEIEARYNLRKYCIQKYMSEVKDPVEKRIAEAYFIEERQTAKAMADFFDIPRTSAHYMIRNLKQKLRELEYSYRYVK